MSFVAPSNRGYEQIGPDVPLLSGDSSSSVNKNRKALHFILAGLTTVLVAITLSSSFIFHKYSSVGLNVFFSSCILLMCASNISMMYWYSLQQATSRIRFIIYLNSITVILLCICANLYLHGF